MKYLSFLLLSLQLFCVLSHGRDCQTNNIYEEYAKLKEENDKLIEKVDMIQQFYKSQIKDNLKQIETLKFNNFQLSNEINPEQKFLKIIREIKPYQIELWGQDNQVEDYSYFILIFLENQVVVKIICNKNKCNQQKKYTHNAVLEGVSAQRIESGQLKSTQIQNVLSLVYSEQKTQMSNTEYIKQMFKALQQL